MWRQIVERASLHGHDLVVEDHPGGHPGHHQQEVAQDGRPSEHAEITRSGRKEFGVVFKETVAREYVLNLTFFVIKLFL